MAKPIEARKPLGPKWTATKAKTENLKKGVFKPDLLLLVQKHDQAITAFENNEKEGTKQLKAIITGFDNKLTTLSNGVDQLMQKRDEIIKNDEEKFTQCSTTLDQQKVKAELDDEEVLKMLDGWGIAGDDYVNSSRNLNEQILKADAALVTLVKRTQAEYKAKLTFFENAYDRINGDGNSAEAQLRALALVHQKTAAGMKDTDSITAIREFIAQI